MGFGEGSVGQLGAREARREISRDMGRYREIKGDIGSAAPEKPGVRAASRCAHPESWPTWRHRRKPNSRTPYPITR